MNEEDHDEYEFEPVPTKNEVSDEIREWIDEARALAERVGLDPYPVNYWVIDNDEMNRLITYGGFQHRYPHWRWGMKYDKQAKESEYGGGKAFEIVNNDNPAHAFLQVSNRMSEQKAVVTHVEAHSDFFKNNRWFDDDPDAAAMLSRNADRIEEIMESPDVDREDVEALIDTMLCIEDTIDQHGSSTGTTSEGSSVEDKVDSIGISEPIKNHVFDEEWIEEHSDDTSSRVFHDDVMEFFIENGGRYDEDEEEVVEFEDWEKEVMSIIREEAYYFAPQKMTKVMNEGWAAFWQSLMMGNEQFADVNEFVHHADMQSRVLSSPGMNPYELGVEIWRYIENRANRREVVEKLLQVDGVTPRTFYDYVDFDDVLEHLDRPDAYSPAVRNFSLVRPQNKGVLPNVTMEQLEEQYRYIFDESEYDTVEEALNDIDYRAGWDRMFEVRETHMDATFLNEFVTDEFVRSRNYFAYDYNPQTGFYEVSSTDPDDVKKKMLQKFTNFGKPSIVVEDGNFRNSGELLVTHLYNGIPVDMDEAKEVMKRLYEIWGRPVNFRTVTMSGASEVGVTVRYDGSDVEELEMVKDDYEYILPEDLDYDVRPEEWLIGADI